MIAVRPWPLPAFHHSLRCLAQPASLLSLGVLVVNDHALKAAVPSWLTGKLSDFAGLFFFPFVVAAGMGVLGLDTRRAGRLAFSLTLAWFVLVKTTLVANALTHAGLRLLGLPAQIVLDPSDLIALVMLCPAWRLWLMLPGGRPLTAPPDRAGLLALAAASLASLATSCPPFPWVERIMAAEGVVYAQYRTFSESYVASQDAGHTWAVVELVPDEVSRAWSQRPPEIALACDPLDGLHCFRLSQGRETVEESLDGGQSWDAVWRVPAGRRAFMERYTERVPSLLCPADAFSAVAFDLTVFRQAGQLAVVVSMGADGALARTPQGAWERLGVLEAGPTPFAAEEPWLAVQTTHWEAALWAMGGLLALLGFSAWGWRAFLPGAIDAGSPGLRRAVVGARPLALLLTAFWLLGVIILGPDPSLEEGLEPLVALGLSLVFGVGPVTLGLLLLLAWGVFALWGRVARQSARPGQARQAARGCLWASLAVFAAGYLPFLLWAVGVIAVYAAAWVLSLTLSALALGAGARWLRRHIRQA